MAENRNTLLVGKDELPYAHGLLNKMGLHVQEVPQVYEDGKPLNPEDGNVRIGWQPVSDDPRRSGEVRQTVSDNMFNVKNALKKDGPEGRFDITRVGPSIVAEQPPPSIPAENLAAPVDGSPQKVA